MYIIKTGLNKNERRVIEYILSEIVDLYSDFYITRSNIRIPLRENVEILFDCLKKGDKIVFDPDKEDGIALVTGWSDKSDRKYVKVLTRSEEVASHLLKMLNWNTFVDLYVKLKKNSKFAKVFQNNGYRFLGDRGAEILLCRKYIPRLNKEYSKDAEGDNDGFNN